MNRFFLFLVATFLSMKLLPFSQPAYGSEVMGLHLGQVLNQSKMPLINSTESRKEFWQKQKQLTLIFFFAEWCPYCKEKLPLVNDLFQKYKDCGIDVVGISLDDTQKDYEKGLKKLKPEFPTAFDETKNIKKLLSIQKIPAFTFLDSAGRVTQHFVGISEYNQVPTLLAKAIDPTVCQK